VIFLFDVNHNKPGLCRSTLNQQFDSRTVNCCQ